MKGQIIIFIVGTIIVRETIDCDESSQQSITLMGEDILSLSCTVAEPIYFQIGDYCWFFNKKYTINSSPKKTLNSERQIIYNIVLESQMYELGRSDFLFLNSVNDFENPIFNFRGTARDYGDLLIYNLRRDFPQTNWILGNVIDSDFITQDFNSTNCLDALKTIANIFQTEYLVEGNIINIYRKQISSGIILKHGSDEALLSITEENQTNANLITQLRVFGSTKNITNDFMNGSGRLRMQGGDIIRKDVDTYGLFCKTIIFDGQTTDIKTNKPLQEIYPHREGTITSEEPGTTTDYFLYFYDTDIDFNVNDYLIPANTAQVEFNTGLLTGYTFKIDEFDNTLKRFKLIQNTDSNLTLPTSSLKPLTGDKYVVINIKQPNEYIIKAQQDLKNAGQDYIDRYCIPPVVYTNTCNSFYFQQRNATVLIGQVVGIVNNELRINRSLRVITLTRNIQNTNLYTMQLADTANPESILVKILNGL